MMKLYPILILFLSFISSAQAQSEQQIARYFQDNPEADANGDGTLTREEARSHRQAARRANTARRDPTQGGNLSTVTGIPGVEISQAVSPVVEVPLKSQDGIDLTFFYRTPPGDGPFPAILFFHGGGGYSTHQKLKTDLLKGTMHTRFLKAGFTIATATRRPYWKSEHNFETIGFLEAVDDTTLIVNKASSLDAFDKDNIILYGGSGGAMLAISTASKVDVAAVVAGEPASVLLFAELDESRERPDYEAIMKDPKGSYKGKFRKNARAMFKAIDSPILILHGDIHALKKINSELLVPELKRLKKDVIYSVYPGLNHGFYWGNSRAGATLKTVDQLMEEVPAFISKHTTLKTAK